MEALIRQVAISALLFLVAVLVFIPISPVNTAAPTFTYHTWTGPPRVSTTVTVPHTHTRWTDPSPPYSWPPPGYYPPSAAYCDPNDPSSYCWDPQCAPQCGYQAVVTESGTTMVSVVTAPPSTVVTTQTQLQTIVFTQPPTQTVTGTQSPDYTPIAVAIVTAAVIIGLLMNRRIRRPLTSTTQPGLPFCKSCGKQIPIDSQFCKFCGSAQ